MTSRNIFASTVSTFGLLPRVFFTTSAHVVPDAEPDVDCTVVLSPYDDSPVTCGSEFRLHLFNTLLNRCYDVGGESLCVMVAEDNVLETFEQGALQWLCKKSASICSVGQ